MSGGVALGTKRLRAVQIAVVLLLLIVIFSVVKRFVIVVGIGAWYVKHAGTTESGETLGGSSCRG
jgi:hypothetical protein